MSILTVAVFDEKPQNALTKVAIIIICILYGEDVLRPCRSIVQPVGIITLRGVQLLLGLIDLSVRAPVFQTSTSLIGRVHFPLTMPRLCNRTWLWSHS